MKRTPSLLLLTWVAIIGSLGCSVEQGSFEIHSIDELGAAGSGSAEEPVVEDFTKGCGSSEVAEVYYLDEDSDGFGNENKQALSCGVPSDEYVLRAGDCDDENPALNPATEWYEDVDRDGFGAGEPAASGCSQPRKDLVQNDEDCNDSAEDGATFFPGMTWYKDADGDGFGNPDSSRITPTCELTLQGFVVNFDDCNDESEFEVPTQTWYPDRDGDGYAMDDQEFLFSCARPDVFARTLDELQGFGDCDDTDDSAYPGQSFYKDKDRDGAGDPQSTPVTACKNPNHKEYASNSLDCDDQNPSRFFGNQEVCDGIDNDCDNSVDDNDFDIADQLTWVEDADGDLHGSGAEVTTQCFAPSDAHRADAVANDDCDDSEPRAYPGATEECDGFDNDCDDDIDESGTAATLTTFYLDEDQDGFGVDGTGVKSCNPPADNTYATTAGDCDDDPLTGAAINPETLWYEDYDGDGYGRSNAVLFGRVRYGCVQPEGYVGNTLDCDDFDEKLHPLTEWYRDVDGDGWGVDVVYRTQCARPSLSYREDELQGFDDCNDNVALIHPETVWFKDEDGDGFGDEAVTPATQCQAPDTFWKYGLENTDCDDDPVTGAAYFPGMIWYEDKDGDGYGGPPSADTSCRVDEPGHLLTDGDCDDAASWTYPGAAEICDKQRNDCNDPDWVTNDDMHKAAFIGDDGTIMTWSRPGDEEMVVIAPDGDGTLNICGRSWQHIWHAQIVADQINLDIRGLSNDNTPQDDVYISGERQGQPYFPVDDALITLTGDPAEPGGTMSSHSVSVSGLRIVDARQYAAYTLDSDLSGTKGGAIYARNVNLDLSNVRLEFNSAERGHAVYAERCDSVAMSSSVYAYSEAAPPTTGPVGSAYHFQESGFVQIDGDIHCSTLTNGNACIYFNAVADAMLKTGAWLRNDQDHVGTQLALFDLIDSNVVVTDYQVGRISASDNVVDDIVGARLSGASSLYTDCQTNFCKIIGTDYHFLDFDSGTGVQVQLGGPSDATNDNTFESPEFNWGGFSGVDVLVWDPIASSYVGYSSDNIESGTCSQEAASFGCQFGTL